jgi:predicted DNA-binding ribbon-helix-helix protein
MTAQFSTYGFWTRAGRETSVRLEPEVLKTLRYLAFKEGITVAEVLRRIDAIPRPRHQSFSSAVRCYGLRTLMQEVLDLSARNANVNDDDGRAYV